MFLKFYALINRVLFSPSYFPKKKTKINKNIKKFIVAELINFLFTFGKRSRIYKRKHTVIFDMSNVIFTFWQQENYSTAEDTL